MDLSTSEQDGKEATDLPTMILEVWNFSFPASIWKVDFSDTETALIDEHEVIVYSVLFLTIVIQIFHPNIGFQPRIW